MRLAIIQARGHGIEEYGETAAGLLALVNKACEQKVDFVLLPECAYPAYLIGHDKGGDATAFAEQFISDLCDAAREHTVHIAAGVAKMQGERLYNRAIVIDPMGYIIGSADKTYLWHFDGKWFSAGDPGFAFDSPFGRIGVMICADGRIPEVARILRLRGAQIIFDLVNLVASAPEPALLKNQQHSFILQTRAMENRVPIVVCNKVGVEKSSVTFLGRSFAALPTGEIIAEASCDREEILYCNVVPTPFVEISGRKPSLYGTLTKATQELPIYGILNDTYRLGELEIGVTVSRFSKICHNTYGDESKKAIQAAQQMDSRLVVLSPAPQGSDSMALVSVISKELDEGVLAIFSTSEKNGEVAYIVSRAGLARTLHKTHGPVDYPIEALEIFPHIRVSILFGTEMMIPEIARVAMLNGADMLIWFDYAVRAHEMKYLATRSAENRIYTLRCSSADEDFNCVVDPNGTLLFSTFRTGTHYAMGMVDTARSKNKTIVPGTNIVTTRLPQKYKELI